MQYLSVIISFIVFMIFYLVYRNRYGWTNYEFEKAYKNKRFIQDNNLQWFIKINRKLVIYLSFIVLFFILLICFEVMSSIFMYDNRLTISFNNDLIYLDCSSNVWKIKDIVNNKTILEFNTIWLVNIIQLLFAIFFSLFVILYLKISNANKYKNEIWFSDYEIESKEYKFNKLSHKKLTILILSLIALHFAFQYSNTFMQLEKPNIDGYIDNNENLFSLLNIKVTIHYNETWVDSFMLWIQILFLVLSCLTLLLIIVLISLHGNYSWLIFQNNFYKMYLNNNKIKEIN